MMYFFIAERMISRKYFQEISELMLTFQRQNYLCDTVIVCKDKKISAHRVLLAAASPVFKRALDEQIAASGRGFGMHLLNLSHFKSDLLDMLINFIYTGKLELPHHYYQRKEDLSDFLIVLRDLGIHLDVLNGVEIAFVR